MYVVSCYSARRGAEDAECGEVRDFGVCGADGGLDDAADDGRDRLLRLVGRPQAHHWAKVTQRDPPAPAAELAQPAGLEPALMVGGRPAKAQRPGAKDAVRPHVAPQEVVESTVARRHRVQDTACMCKGLT